MLPRFLWSPATLCNLRSPWLGQDTRLEDHMETVADKVMALLRKTDGLTDRELATRAFGHGSKPQRANNECRFLEQRGLIERKSRPDGLTGNYLTARGRISN